MTRWLSLHGRTLVLAFIVLTLAGLGAASRLPVGLFPQIAFPRVVVSVDAGERAADQMEAEVTRPLELALRAVPGVAHVRSTTSRGAAEIAVSFDWGRDMVSALLQTQAALSTVTPDLPAGVRFEVRRMDPTVFPILGLAVSSPTRPATELRAFAEQRLRPLIAPVSGVALVDVKGGRDAEFQVTIDPARAQSVGLSLDDVAKAVNAANTVEAVGRLEDRHRLYLILVDTRVHSPEDLGDIPVKTGAAAGAGVVLLKQIADIRRAPAPAWTRVSAQGRDAVLVNVRQTPEADSVSLVKAIKARLAGLKASMPGDVQITPFYDQTELVTAAAGSVRDAILFGAVLAGLVLFLFLRSLRLMLITAILLPAVLATSCLLLLALHMSFNMMTLGGLAAAVGLVVDDVVVMLEHIMRRLGEDGEPRGGSVLGAAGEMLRPMLGATASTLVVFAPLAFLGGVSGGFFQALAVTMAAALLISLFYALFVVPVIAKAWLRPQDVAQAHKAEGLLQRLRSGYAHMSRATLARPLGFIGLIAVILLAAGGFAFSQLPSGFMPKMDEGGFVLDYKAKPGAALTETDALLRQAEAIIRATPGVDSYSRRTGLQLDGSLSEADEGDFFIHLKRGDRRPIEDIMAEIRTRIQREVPGLDIETAQLMEDLIGDLTAVPQPIEIKLFGSDPDALRQAAQSLAPAIAKISGVVEVIDGLRVAGDDLVVTVNRPAAALEGVGPGDVASQLQTLIGGAEAGRALVGQRLYTLRIWAPQALKDRIEALSALRLRAADGHDFPLSRVATLTLAPGLKQITRQDLQPYVGVTARLEKRDLGGAMAEIRKTVAGLSLPAGVRLEYGGLYAEQQSAFGGLALVFAAALLLVSILLVYLFESWAALFSVVTVVLLSASAVLLGLWATGTELNISALMGLTMVIGIVAELAVFYLAELDWAAPIDSAALLHAGGARLRPILMSAAIAILALSPLALGLGEGAEMQKPLAIAIISGLLAGAPLVLFVLPAAFVGFSRRRRV